MKSKSSLSVQDQAWLKKFGVHVEKLILDRGYKSVYDFWIQKAGDHISRASLNNLITGKKDFRLTTIRKLSKLLNLPAKALLDFE